MTLTHAGLICDMAGVALVGFDSWVKVRGIRPDRILVGTEVGGFWEGPATIIGYLLVLAGFLLQYLGSP